MLAHSQLEVTLMHVKVTDLPPEIGNDGDFKAFLEKFLNSCVRDEFDIDEAMNVDLESAAQADSYTADILVHTQIPNADLFIGQCVAQAIEFERLNKGLHVLCECTLVPA